MKVYLSGSLKSDWQDEVIDSMMYDCEIIDPRENDCNDPQVFTKKDLKGIRDCDIVFAYLEEDNPSGIGLALEVGYGKSLGKYIILVNEKDDTNFDIVNCTSHKVYNNLNDGLRHLKLICSRSQAVTALL